MEACHEDTVHGGEFHHHHSHASSSRHARGHHLLQVENLSVSFAMYDTDDRRFFRAARREVQVIENLNVSVHEGEIVAIVGASGSGKTLLADAVMGIFEPNASVCGTVWFDGKRQDATSLASLRGHGISLVPQGVSHLDPLMKVGKQVRGYSSSRTDMVRRKRRQRELFEHYGLPSEIEKRYPFELSGGQARRVLLMCALMDEPRLIVADEPTPGLDVELAVRAMDDLRVFADEGGGVLLITHDIELALRVADRVAVFKDGTVVEETSVENFATPDALMHPFSRELWHALPEHDFDGVSSDAAGEAHISGGESVLAGDEAFVAPSMRSTDAAASVSLNDEALTSSSTRSANGTISASSGGEVPALRTCEENGVRDITSRLFEARGIRFGYGGNMLYDGFDLAVRPGERVALCAPSGFGKTTLCYILSGYIRPQAGGVFVDGAPLSDRGVMPVQLIGQHPELMVDSRLTMRASLEEAGPVQSDVCVALGIRDEWMRRYPHELSGGEVQRFCIARALSANPRYLVCDEISTMLDASAQAQLWRFVLEWCERSRTGLVFTSHSEALVRRVATRVVALRRDENGMIRVG